MGSGTFVLEKCGEVLLQWQESLLLHTQYRM